MSAPLTRRSGRRERRLGGVSDHHADDKMYALFDERAPEYDSYWLGTGSHADRDRPGWDEAVEQLIAALQALPPGRVLDVACGTGFLTQHLAGEVVALDQSSRMVEIATARMPHARVIQAEIPPLPFEDGEFDRVFTSLFFHHLSRDGRAAFVAEALRVGRELVVVEDVRHGDAPAEEQREFVLDDGSHHHMHRHSFTPAELGAELGDGKVLHEGRYFVMVTVG